MLFYSLHLTPIQLCARGFQIYLFLSPFPTSTKFYLSGHDVNANTWIYVWDLHNASQSVCIFAIVTFVFAVHCACVCVLYSTLHKIKIMKWKRNTNHTNSLIMAKMQIRSFFSQIFIVVDKSEETSSKNIFLFIHFLWVSISWPSFVELIVENHKRNYLTSCEWVIFVSINWIEGNHKVAKWNEFDCILVELIKGKSGKDNEFNERKHRKKYSLKLYNLGAFFTQELLNEWWKSEFFSSHLELKKKPERLA